MGISPAAAESPAATGVVLPKIAEVIAGSPPAVVEIGFSVAAGVILPTTLLFLWGTNLRAARPESTGQPSGLTDHVFLALRALFF